MDAAFDLFPAAPAAGAGVFAGAHLAGAWRAADRGIAVGLERVAGERVVGEIGVELGLGPIGQRVDLEPALGVAGIDLETRQAGAARRLEALAPGEGRVEAGDGARQRLDLA